MQKRTLLPLGLVAFAAGCFTVSETPSPTVTFRADPAVATNVTVAVRGFATSLTRYTTATGYQTIFYDGAPGVYGPGVATAQSTTVIPQIQPSDRFLDQARSRLESIGFNIMAPTPDYVVEARFSGPVTTTDDTVRSVTWFICSLLTCDHRAESWCAQLKIHDNRTGRLVLTRDYEQRYEVTGFSPIPLIGISSYERTSANYMQCWCLGALTERMIAETAEFLTARK